MNDGIYKTLMDQVDRLAKHNRQGSYHTKQRYYEAMQRFCRYLADEYHLQKLSNVSGKHMAAYADFMKAAGKSPSTIKTDLAAIRFFHDLLDDRRHPLPGNSDLHLERRRFGELDRTWSQGEYDRFLEQCRSRGHENYADVASLTWEVGLRIHEGFRLDTAAAEAALRTGELTVKGKGGKIRSVPITDNARAILSAALSRTKRGHKLFVRDGVPTDTVIHNMQVFLSSVRPRIQDVGSTRPMTHHGLRHTYAARKYQEFVQNGYSHYDACKQVSRLLGHERAEVTRIYLASLSGKG
mgnify:CR=1 FL=1